jgi:hypothetical protein
VRQWIANLYVPPGQRVAVVSTILVLVSERRLAMKQHRAVVQVVMRIDLTADPAALAELRQRLWGLVKKRRSPQEVAEALDLPGLTVEVQDAKVLDVAPAEGR